MKMPALQFYPADWRKDPAVQSLSYHDRGVWFEMLCLMHESSERGVLLLNGLSMPEDALARVLGLDNQTLNQTLTTILTYGAAKKRSEDGAIYSKRMVEDEKLCQTRRKAGKLGGNPRLLNQNLTTGVKQIPTPSSSSSSSDYIYAGNAPDHPNQQAEKQNLNPLATAPASRKKSKAPIKTPLPNDFCISERVRTWANGKGVSSLDAHFDNFVGACKAKGYTYVDWDEGFMGAIRKDWANLGVTGGGAKPWEQ